MCLCLIEVVDAEVGVEPPWCGGIGPWRWPVVGDSLEVKPNVVVGGEDDEVLVAGEKLAAGELLVEAGKGQWIWAVDGDGEQADDSHHLSSLQSWDDDSPLVPCGQDRGDQLAARLGRVRGRDDGEFRRTSHPKRSVNAFIHETCGEHGQACRRLESSWQPTCTWSLGIAGQVITDVEAWGRYGRRTHEPLFRIVPGVVNLVRQLAPNPAIASNSSPRGVRQRGFRQGLCEGVPGEAEHLARAARAARRVGIVSPADQRGFPRYRRDPRGPQSARRAIDRLVCSDRVERGAPPCHSRRPEASTPHPRRIVASWMLSTLSRGDS